MSDDQDQMSQEVDDEIAVARAKWEQEVLAPLLKKHGLRQERFVRSGGEEVDGLYVPSAKGAAAAAYMEKLGFPGQYPFTRGVQPTMYRGRYWTMRQYAGFGTAAQSNERYHYLLKQGTMGLSVAFDLPTQMGYDSDSPRARGEVGKVGVAIDSIADMETLFKDIPLDQVSTSMTINSTASILLALYIVVAERNGVPSSKLRGTIQNDLLKEYIARGTYIYPPRASMRIITDIFGYCEKYVPKWNTISISGYHIREAGSTAAQEVGFTLANGIAYVQAAQAAGLDVDAFAPQLSFFFNVHNNFLEEVAKFRAARRLWARIMRERFGAKDERSWMLRFHSQVAGSTLTAQQPQVNIVRVALQAMAAVMGGTQSLHTNGWDEALALPTEEAARIALRTQQVIAHESGVADVIDPLGGAWAVEAMTDEIEASAVEYIRQIDELGGAVAAIEQGFQQAEIQEAAYRMQMDIERGRQIIVGVNQYQIEEPRPEGLLKVDGAIEAEQIARLRDFKAGRDSTELTAARARLEAAARGSDNLMGVIVDAVRAKMTLGEIADTLRGVFGEYVERVVF
jgi:methylmalonyl-CoA mutase N-terminal domain/subunit